MPAYEEQAHKPTACLSCKSGPGIRPCATGKCRWPRHFFHEVAGHGLPAAGWTDCRAWRTVLDCQHPLTRRSKQVSGHTIGNVTRCGFKRKPSRLHDRMSTLLPSSQVLLRPPDTPNAGVWLGVAPTLMQVSPRWTATASYWAAWADALPLALAAGVVQHVCQVRKMAGGGG